MSAAPSSFSIAVAAARVVAASPPHLQALGRARTLVNPVGLGTAGAVAAAFGATSTGMQPLFALWLVLLCFGVPVVLSLLRGRAFYAARQAATAALSAGDVARAASLFDDCARRFRWFVSWHAVSVFSLAYCRLRQGRLAEARTLFREVAGAPGLRTIPGGPAAARYHGATCAALCGDLDEADALLAEGDRRGGAAGRGWLLPKAIVLLQRGRELEAASLLESSWRDGERALRPDLMRALRLVRAYAILHGSVTADDAQTAAHLLAGARPFRPGDYDWLGAAWPAMQQFLGQHGLARHSLAQHGLAQHGLAQHGLGDA